MTKQEWMASSDLTTMLAWRHDMDQVSPPPRGLGWGMINDRKLRLLACAVFRTMQTGGWGYEDTPTQRANRVTIKVVEDRPEEAPLMPAHGGWAASLQSPASGIASIIKVADLPGRPGHVPSERIADLIRDTFGNPFRLVTLRPEWMTPDVLTLATSAYKDRMPDNTLDPLTLAALADALEEAGCSADDLLVALRSPGPHYRGFWPVDLALGKA